MLQRAFNPTQCDTIRWAASHFSSAASAKDEVPFTLVQGPPGTGKTHTVWGLLNVLHFVQFQRYYASLMKVHTAMKTSRIVTLAFGTA